METDYGYLLDNEKCFKGIKVSSLPFGFFPDVQLLK